MDKKRFYKKGDQNIFRVDKAFNIEIKILEIDSDYKLIYADMSHVSETGALVLFELTPNLKSIPSFLGRWDQNYGTLDVDIIGVEEKIAGFFNAEKNGYSGHHPKRISEISRTYDLQIKLPERNILSAHITFTINHGHVPGLFA